jgi:hypothetical protein
MRKQKRHPHSVCKPCWELNYCPYGPLVEEYPLSSGQVTSADVECARIRYETAWSVLTSPIKSEDDVHVALHDIQFFNPSRWELLADYDSTELQCNVYGHVCPIFFLAVPFTETKEDRRVGRYIPRKVMFKVVRRDGQICQKCHKHVPDDEIHFDHVIPVARGGRSSVQNLRVLCQDCNLKKSDSLTEILTPK